MNPPRIYDYLVLTRTRILDAVRTLSPDLYAREFAFGLKTIGPTLAHIMVSEWYYIERLAGRHVPPYDQWPIKYEPPHTPSFNSIEAAWREQANNSRSVIAAEHERGDWSRTITWRSLAPAPAPRMDIVCTAGDLFTQLAFHEVHHRSQVMAMLRELAASAGAAIPTVADLDFNALMFERRKVE